MSESTGIDWTVGTWNPWTGCYKRSPGCDQCYMYREMLQYGKDPKLVKRSAPDTFNAPLAWARYWENPDRKPRKVLPPKPGDYVFACSWSDWFIKQADEWRAEAWDIVKRTPFIYQILTKRPDRIESCLPPDWGDGYPNVWLGVSVESQDYLKRADILAKIPAALRFISYEPALGSVNFGSVLSRFGWLIGGGESGYNPRHAPAEWFEYARVQCKAFGIPYFHKQNGGREKFNGTWGGKHLNGEIYQEFPVFELPKIETVSASQMALL